VEPLGAAAIRPREHIMPYLGGVPLSRLSTRLIREWRATALHNSVSVSVAGQGLSAAPGDLMTAATG
jgi:hypothetical protein